MKFWVLFSLCLAVAASYPINVQIPGTGRFAYVDSEDVLENSLQRNLRRFGVYDVDIDNHYRQNGQFEVEIESTLSSEDKTKHLLSRGLKELGFFDATVKGGFRQFESGFIGKRVDYFTVYLNPQTMDKTLASLAANSFHTTDLSIEDHSFELF